MTLPVVYHKEAEADFEEAQAWYEARGRGLGQEFVTEVQALIESVRRNPALFQRIDGELRRALVRRFPYAVLYLADPDVITASSPWRPSKSTIPWRTQARVACYIA